MELSRLLAIMSVFVFVSCGSPTTYKPYNTINRLETSSQPDCVKEEEKFASLSFYQVEKRPSIEVSLMLAEYNHLCWSFPEMNLMIVQSQQSRKLLLFYNRLGKYLYTINLHNDINFHSDESYFPNLTEMYQAGRYLIIKMEDATCLFDPANPQQLVNRHNYRISYTKDKDDPTRLYLAVIFDDYTGNGKKLKTKSIIYAFNRNTRASDWQTTVIHGYEEYNPYLDFKQILGIKELMIISYGSRYSCIREKDGSVVWTRDDIYFQGFKDEMHKDYDDITAFGPGVVYAWNMQTVEGWDHNPLFEGRNTKIHSVSIYTGKTLWTLDYPGIGNSMTYRQKIDDDKMLFVFSNGIYEVSHTKGILRKHELVNNRFSEKGWMHNGKLYAMYIRPPKAWLENPKIIYETAVENFYKCLLCFDPISWKVSWTVDLIPCYYSATKQGVYFIPLENNLIVCLFEGDCFSVDYATGKMLKKWNLDS